MKTTKAQKIAKAWKKEGIVLKNTKSQRIANTIQNTLENMQEEENKISAHAEQLDSNSVLFIQKENGRRENAVEGLRKKLDELND